eukprot:s165_g14.t2
MVVYSTALLLFPEDFLGRGYDILKLVGGDEVELNFMLDTGLTTSILYPGRADELGVERPSRQAHGEVPTVILEDLRFREGLLIGSLRPFIMDFPQRRMGASMGMQIDGMLGMEFFERFTMEVDASALRLYEADCGEKIAVANDMVTLTTAPLPARLLGVHLGLPGSDQCVCGVIDTGASFTDAALQAGCGTPGFELGCCQDAAQSRGGRCSADAKLKRRRGFVTVHDVLKQAKLLEAECPDFIREYESVAKDGRVTRAAFLDYCVGKAASAEERQRKVDMVQLRSMFDEVAGPGGQIRVADLIKHRARIQAIFPPLLEKFSEIDLSMSSTVSWAELEVYAGGTGEWLEYQLDRVVGLELLKQQIRQFHHSVVLDKKREDAGHKVKTGGKYHMIFQGNPGTGKTSLARVIAQLLHRIGIIQTDLLVEVQRDKLVAEYVGQTGPKTQKVIEQAKQGVLFIDEAYRLSQDNGKSDFGREAIEQLMGAMNDPPGKAPIMVFAGSVVAVEEIFFCLDSCQSGRDLGYADDMDLFMQANSGLYRRIGYTFDFSDYAPVELAEILNSIVRGAGFKLAPSLSANSFQRLSNVIEAKTLEEAREMMNGGLCERLFDFAKQSLDAREAVVSATNPSLEITEGDILEACRRIPPPPVREGRRGDSREAGDQSMLLRRTEAQLRTAKSEVQRLHAQLRAVKAVSAQNVAWKEEAMPEYSVRFCCRYSFGCLCVSSVDAKGRELLMPTVADLSLQLRGAGRAPRRTWDAAPVEVAIGDVASFEQIFGQVVKPCALIGQDLLTQAPMLLAARQRLLCLSEVSLFRAAVLRWHRSSSTWASRQLCRSMASQEAKGMFASLSTAKLGTLNLGALETAASQHNLQVLDLKDHKISAIPAQVLSAFTHVKVLDLRKNALEELLPDIRVMSQLEDLLLDQNRLREIPDEVCLLPHLRGLSLSQNLLKMLPKAVGSMKSLKSLSLGDNFLEEIPVELGQCKELQTLYLHHNSFTSLPSSLSALENLQELALEWFRYTTPPLPRVIKGAEWQRIIVKLKDLCREKKDKDARVSCIEVLSEFSQKAFDPNAIDSKRRTRLHVACLEGHVGVALALAENGSKCDSLDCEGYSPLLVAVREEHPDIANALVRVGVDVNRGGGLFGSPLHVATVNFDPQMVMLLIRGKADVNQTDADGNAPLHVLMSVFDKGGKRAAAIGKILLQHNADCNMMNSDKWAPLHLAARRGQLRGIAFVLSNLDSFDAACQKGTCSHQSKKPKGSRVRTCPQVFDLNLRGGSHLWTPLHLAGHACHVNVVQVLIEAGSDVFLRNVDGRTARHVSRGNLAISKLLRKAEDEWLWYRIHQGFADMKETVKPLGDVSAATEPSPDIVVSSPRNTSVAARDSDELLETFRVEDEEDDPIEEIAKTIEGPAKKGSGPTAPQGPPDPGRAPIPQLRTASRPKMQRITEKCQDSYFSREELHALQALNFAKPVGEGPQAFIDILHKLLQKGPKERLPYLLSKAWVKELVPEVLENEKYHHILLSPELVCNEDFLRMIVSNLPQDRLTILGKMRNNDQDTLLHVVCKGMHAASPGADILSFLLSACPKGTFDLEARDMRGQTSLHLAAQNGDLGLVQVLLDNNCHPNSQEETTGWTPLHFAVSKAHYSVILQLLQHAETDVNQVDKFEWPPILEACSRLDARATSLLVNGRANLAFRSQHQFDVLKAVDTSKKDLAAKRWMSCLVVSNGFRLQESSVQLTAEDRETLHREQAYFNTRSIPATHPPFFVPDHLAPRCHSCKVLFSVTVRRYHCRIPASPPGAVCMKRGPSEQEPATQVKRQKEMDAAPSASSEREHLMLMKVLQPAQAPAQKLSVANVGEFLDAEAARLARQRGLEEALLFLAQPGPRKALATADATIPWREEGGSVPSTWEGIAPFQEASVLAVEASKLAELRAGGLNRVALILALLNGRVPVRLMNELLVAAAEDDAVPAALVSKLAEQLRGRTLNDLRSQQFSQLIHVLRARKDKKDSKYISALVGAPLKEEIWRPPFEPKFVWRGRKNEIICKQLDGLFLQENTLLGWALSPSALDGALMPPSKAHLTEAGSKEWEGLGRATRQRIDGLQKGLQNKLTSSQDQAAEFVDILLRAGDEPRMAVLEWLGAVVTAAEPRGRQGQPAPEGFNFWPQYGNIVIDNMQQTNVDSGAFVKSLKNLLLLQAIHARLQGFPTSGAALNTFTLLLHLIKPIKAEQAATISAFLPLRDDVPQLLGNYKKEARFGEKEQVEAATESAKSALLSASLHSTLLLDPTYTAALSDKTLFKSEVFWLATKGIGYLLMPVAKEAFHAWQGIASVFYDKDASVVEPRFLERLGHLVDLTFRFLQTAAAGSEKALPPPQPGPTWHVVPSSALENIIELCDLYRDRDRSKSGGIPTGLFVHVDPDPVMTTLCVVMASEDHVRDPSLRGRAARGLEDGAQKGREALMHRTEDKLNLPPLDKHLIPCLINVFIAVEKAIMSYYDLSYRYKYELRVPVMDLFDLALQTEGHREVLEKFINGDGNERFQKLLTQLINDSNSQIEEAIKTVQDSPLPSEMPHHDFHAKQSESAASGSASQRHDEQVLEDDRTGDGDEAEDIYRRSRMNYKEHAKKYFGLASKTWKQMWLLCKLCAPTIVAGSVGLEQLLHSSLDAQLHYLVGPDMKKIKASPQEYDELGFNPKELIKQIVEMYLFLAKANKAEVVRVVGKDERYYSSNTFSKATNFELAEKVSQHRAAFDEAEIPQEYLCEIMADIMSDPVMFPQSRKVADRTAALRVIMGADRDPFANTPLKELVPQTELKEQIHRFAKEKGIALEGGNMGIIIVPLDERQNTKVNMPLNESRLTAAVELSLDQERGASPGFVPDMRLSDEPEAGAKSAGSDSSASKADATEGGLNRERGGGVAPIMPTSGHAQMVRLCGPCCTFFEAGVGETYSMQRKSSVGGATML